MTYKYTSGIRKTDKIRIANKVSQDFFGVDYNLMNLRKRDFDAIWNIAERIFCLTFTNEDKSEINKDIY